MRRTRWAAIAVALSVIAGACGDDDAPNDSAAPDPASSEVVEVRSDVERDTPSLTTHEVVEADREFALRLYQELRADAPEENLFFSPYSIAVALSMALAGAEGDTRAQLEDVLGAAGHPDWHAARNALDQQLLEERTLPEGMEDLQPLELAIANSVWGQADYPFRDTYLDLLARHYGSGLRTVDFVREPDAARRAINDWVEDATEDRIVDLIPEDVVDPDTRLVLANAIYFRANWVEPFDPDETEDATFTTHSGDEVTVPMMHGEPRTVYVDGDGWAAVSLPYAGAASMVVVAPDEGRFDEVAQSLDAAMVDEISTSSGDFLVDLRMPRFDVGSTINLVDPLDRIGVVDAFLPPRGGQGADFTGIVDRRELFISDAIHQADITVDEEGTEASAATAMIFNITSMPSRVELTLDRPFLVVIQDHRTGSILFVGQITDPTAG